MHAVDAHDAAWPALDYAALRDTLATLQLWSQIVGKVRLALTPWLNHGWQVPLYVDGRGLGSSPIHVGGEIVEIGFDLVDHRLVVRSSRSSERGFALVPMSVAAFYRRLMAELAAIGVEVAIDTLPSDQYPQAAFYSYAYPAPAGFAAAKVEPPQAAWSAAMGEWLLPYEAARGAADPEAALMRFLQSTYRAAADLARWDRALECDLGLPGRPRTVANATS